jgi:hypothetical protein
MFHLMKFTKVKEILSLFQVVILGMREIIILQNIKSSRRKVFLTTLCARNISLNICIINISFHFISFGLVVHNCNNHMPILN